MWAAVCAPQVFLPLKKWEAAWLGWLSAVPVPKATFLKGLSGTWGFNSVILPKNAGKKTYKLLHCLGWSHGGNPGRPDGDAGREQTEEGSELLGYPAAPEPSGRDSCRLCVFSQRPTLGSVSARSILVLVCLDTSTQLQHADMSIKPETFVFHICRRWQPAQPINS